MCGTSTVYDFYNDNDCGGGGGDDNHDDDDDDNTFTLSLFKAVGMGRTDKWYTHSQASM